MLLTLPSLAPIRVFLPGVAHANSMRWTLFQKQRMIKEWRCVSLCWRNVNGLFAWLHLKLVSMCMDSDLCHEVQATKSTLLVKPVNVRGTIYLVLSQLEMRFPHANLHKSS